MEDKKLNLNRPLLSVRRVPPSVPASEVATQRRTSDPVPKLPLLPVYKSELKSGPVRNPGTVPFVWEKTPGRPKYESKAERQAPECPPVAPKLPPGRVLNVRSDSDGTPGTNSLHAKNASSASLDVPSLEKELNKEENSTEEGERARSCNSDNGDEAYVDAVDTLSRSESFFLNCSVSGVSGLDDMSLGPSQTLSTDPGAQKFMMDRFLPAAKAMATESPQYFVRKQPNVQKQPVETRKVVSANYQRPLPSYRSKNIPQFSLDNKEEESEEDDDDDNSLYNGPEKSSLGVCGLLPRLCLENSVCLMTTIPGLRKQAQAPITSVRTRRVNNSSAPPRAITKNKQYRHAAGESINELYVMGKSEDDYEMRTASDKITGKHNCQTVGGSSPENLMQSIGSPFCGNKDNHSATSNEKGFLGSPRTYKNSAIHGNTSQHKNVSSFRELLANESIEWESGSRSPTVEKTLYIDTVHIEKPQLSSSCSSDSKDISGSKRDDVEMLVRSKDITEIASVESSPQGNKLYTVVGKKLRPKSLESVDSCFLSASGRSTSDVRADEVNSPIQDERLVQISVTLKNPKLQVDDNKSSLVSNFTTESTKLQAPRRFTQDSIALATSKVVDDGKTDLESEMCKKSSNEEISSYSNLLLPLPPPLPKSPSESWLQRTLTTVSSRNLASKLSPGIHLNPKLQASKTQPVGPKWETLVKPSSVHHGHLRFSEELLTPIPEA